MTPSGLTPKPSDQNGQGFPELTAQLEAWTIPEGAVDAVYDAARTSLDEVKQLTEYEDGKASRLLTVIAFLSAVVGAVFTRFASDYAWPGLQSAAGGWLLPAATYVAFFVYVSLVSIAVIIVIHAIKPKFNVPVAWKGTGKSGLPRSMVFYERILDVTPRQWGKAFEALTDGHGKQLKAYYAKCFIREAYLVADKVAVKLRALDWGIRLLWIAMWGLLVFFVLYGLTATTVAPTRNASDLRPAASSPR